MKAYIAISYQGRKLFYEELKAICSALKNGGITPFVFVDHFTFRAMEEKEMMNRAMEEINQSGLLIAAAYEKAIGLGIEAGYAKGKGIPVLYLRNSLAEHSTTLSGLSDHQLIYTDLPDLARKLESFLQKYFPIP